MAKDFSDMTNKELKAYCVTKGIDVDSKNVSKPTNTEFLLAIGEYSKAIALIDTEGLDKEGLESVEDFLNIEDDSDGVQEKEKPETKKITRAEKRKRQFDELMVLRRVMITSNDNNQTTTKNQVHYCTWGNRLLGHNTDRFIVGKPWHVHEGALRNLENMKISRSVQDDEGNTIRFETVPAYVIQRLDQLKENEIAVIAKRQTIRDASIESLI